MKFKKIYDLSQPVYHNCPGWAEYKPTNILLEYNTVVNGFNAETVIMNTHTGTHIDVPYHFFNKKAKIGNIPIETFSGQAVFLDFQGIKEDSPISRKDLLIYENEIKKSDVPVIVTSWAYKRDFSEEYLLKWPYLDKSGAEYLLELGIKGVGIDTLSLGGWGSPEKGRPCHEILLGNDKFIVEELKIPKELINGQNYLFSCFPVLLENCGGAWARAVAYEI